MRSMMLSRGKTDRRSVPRDAVRSLPAIQALNAWIQFVRNRQMMSSAGIRSFVMY